MLEIQIRRYSLISIQIRPVTFYKNFQQSATVQNELHLKFLVNFYHYYAFTEN